jgi:hypothetical protein
VHAFETIEELRQGLEDFAARYNAAWLVARHGYRTPNQVRGDQRRLARPEAADLPLAARRTQPDVSTIGRTASRAAVKRRSHRCSPFLCSWWRSAWRG